MTDTFVGKFEHLLPEAIFDAVESVGGRCTGRFLTLNAMENRVYDVEMEEEVNRIIKFYRPGRWSEETILCEHQFLEALEKSEVPVVCPVKKDGKTLFKSQGIFFTLFPKKPGRLEPELNHEQLKRLGRFLGRIHNAGSAIQGASRMHLTPKTYGRDSLKTLVEGQHLQGNLSNVYQSLANQICDLVEPLFENVETCLVHGDCHAGNVLWMGDNPYFIDFDDMLYAPPVQDMWMLIGGDDAFAMKNRDVLIDAYLEIREFDERTWKLVEPLRSLRMLYFNAWIARRREDGAFKAAFPHFGTERYWQEQIENLSHQLERVRAQLRD